MGYYVRKFLPFFLTPLAQRRTYLLRKSNAEMFRLCGGDKGAALDPRPFEKARPKLFMSEVFVW
jgi:hypothetical protein